MNMTGRNRGKHLLSAILISTLAVTLFSAEVILSDKTEAADVKLSNPHIVADTNMDAGQKVTWDCIWFGSYPQAEVVPSGAYTALEKSSMQDGDIIVSDSIYKALQNATGWNANNEIVLNGVKYRKMQKRDANFSAASNGFYQWSDSNNYHYFMYEPIKWRVLHTDGNSAMLLSDIVLDARSYNETDDAVDNQPFPNLSGNVTWETSTIRSWLNGYGSDCN